MILAAFILGKVRMKSRFTRIFTGITLLVLAVLACNAPAQSLPTATQLPPSELTLISLIETLTTQAQAAPISTPMTNPNTSVTDVSFVFPTATPFVPPTDTPALLQMDTAVPSPVNPQVSETPEDDGSIRSTLQPDRYVKFEWQRCNDSSAPAIA